MSKTPSHFTKITDYDECTIRKLLVKATRIKSNPGVYAHRMKDKNLLMLFEKPSLRTRISFETAMSRFGGNAIYYTSEESPFGKKENVKDTAMCASQYVDVFVLRLMSRESLLEFVKYSQVPVINALDNWAHPCQILADLLTIAELKLTPKPVHEDHLKFNKIRMAYYGDCRNNVTYDLMRAAALLNFKLVLCGPEDSRFKPEQEVWDEVNRINDKAVEWLSDPSEGSKNCDVVYTDSWMSYHIPASEEEERVKVLQRYQVDMEVLKHAKKDVVFMHCLPAKRGQEVTDEYAQQALLLYIVFGSKVFCENEKEAELLSEEKYFQMAPRHLNMMHRKFKEKTSPAIRHVTDAKGLPFNRVVISLGGHALQTNTSQDFSYQDLKDNIDRTCMELAKFIEGQRPQNLCLSHGNGPQVGYIHKCMNGPSSSGDSGTTSESGSKDDIYMPLDMCGALSQAEIGYLFQQSLQNNITEEHWKNRIVSIITQAEVNPNDAAFNKPTKPIGRYYSKEEYQKMFQMGQQPRFAHMKHFKDGYRMVVPSPDPVKIVEENTVKTLIDQGNIVIMGGGGGIPVVRDRNGKLSGIEAVIDKDKTSALIAEIIDADLLVILTQEDGVFLDYRTEKQRKIDKMDTKTVLERIKEGVFEEGSMVPKMEACVQFVTRTKRPAVVTSIENLTKISLGPGSSEGTWIVP
ncbi:hypothetical protein C9374_003042 [Naegleria lovaniensis]|uniref:Carbamate kinase n=1 Tax=Naegleria lovaniensis TaxID=51637 RepID=A0AA88GTB4_NAELO|nr:uncharacterized protein C9374_003042 [Naegleria lovaniensis]KAG2385893.1 hypothetical protein C9374_003042 [Naegleria lovaniensis]